MVRALVANQSVRLAMEPGRLPREILESGVPAIQGDEATRRAIACEAFGDKTPPAGNMIMQGTNESLIYLGRKNWAELNARSDIRTYIVFSNV